MSAIAAVRDMFSSDDALLQRETACRAVPDATSFSSSELERRITESLLEIYPLPDIDVWAVVIINPFTPAEYGSDYMPFFVAADLDDPSEFEEAKARLPALIIESCNIVCLKAPLEWMPQPSSEWEPRADRSYYGPIPWRVTINDLVNIMANGLLEYVQDAQEHAHFPDTEELTSVLDSWFEHDATSDDWFDHLVPEMDGFVDRVMNIVNGQ